MTFGILKHYFEGCAGFIEGLAALDQLNDKDGELLEAGGRDGHGHALNHRPGDLNLKGKMLTWRMNTF